MFRWVCSCALWGFAALVLVGCAETDAACRSTGVHVIKTISRVRGYIDTAGNGCNLACEINLGHGSVDYVDMVYAATQYDKVVAIGGPSAVSFRLPPRDGVFRVTLTNSSFCRELRSRTVENFSGRLGVCLVFNEIAEPDADFEMQAAFSKAATSWGRRYSVEWSFVRRGDQDSIAVARDQYFVWNKKRLLVPELPPDYSCVALHESVIDLRRIYDTNPAE